MEYVQDGLPEWYSCQQGFITFKLFLLYLPSQKSFQGVFIVCLKHGSTGTSCRALLALCFLDQLHELHGTRKVCPALTTGDKKAFSPMPAWDSYKIIKHLITKPVESTSRLLLQQTQPSTVNTSHFTNFFYRSGIILSQNILLIMALCRKP